jgi:hypothetical protein
LRLDEWQTARAHARVKLVLDAIFLYPFDESRRRDVVAGAVNSGARVERKPTEEIRVQESSNVVVFAGLVPIERREIEETVLGPSREQAEDVAQVRPWLDVAESTAREE